MASNYQNNAHCKELRWEFDFTGGSPFRENEDFFIDCAVDSDFFTLRSNILGEECGWRMYLTFEKDSKKQAIRLYEENDECRFHFKTEVFIENYKEECKRVGPMHFEKCRNGSHSWVAYFDVKDYIDFRRLVFEIVIKCELRAVYLNNEDIEQFNFEKMKIAKLVELPRALKLDPFYDSKKYSDLTLVSSNDHGFLVHRCILACASTVLQEIIQSSKNNPLKLVDIDGETLKFLLQFIYFGELKTSDLDQVMDLLRAALKYKMTKLKYICVKFLDENYNSQNVLKVLSLAHQCNEETLVNNCIQYVKMYFNLLETNEDWSLIGPEISLKILNALRKKTIEVVQVNYFCTQRYY